MSENIKSSVFEYLVFLMQNKIDFKNIKIINNEIYLTKVAICNLLDIQDDIDLILSKTMENNNLTFNEIGIYIENEILYNTYLIIFISYTIKTEKALQFRRWSNQLLGNYIKKGYVIDDERIKNGSFFNKEYFEELKFKFDLIKESKRDFYQKITDMYSTSFDYDVFSYFSRRLYIDVINVRNLNDIKQKNKMIEKLLKYAYKKINNQIPMTMSDWNNIIRNYALLYNKNNNLYEYITDYEKMILNQ